MSSSVLDPFCCNQCQVVSWLDDCVPPDAKQPPPTPKQQDHHIDMPTPPQSTSPKRKRNANSEGESGDHETPKATVASDEQRHQWRQQPQQLIQPIPLRPLCAAVNKRARPSPAASNSKSGADSQSQQSRTTSRSTSPVKQVVDLKWLANPVSYHALPNGTSQLPTDIRNLFGRIRRIVRYRTAFIHPAARGIIRKEVDDELPDSVFRAEDEQDDELTRWAEYDGEPQEVLARRQFRALSAIVADAADSEQQHRGELAWNNLVHSPILRLAARSASDGRVICEPIMGASIMNKWLPRLGGDQAQARETAAGKMVDFALVLDLHRPHPEDEALAEAVNEIVRYQPDGLRSINHTNYEPLTLKPIGISVETKCLSAVTDGNIQLGIWTAAWHRCITELLDIPPSTRIITLPLLLCHGHTWDLYLACDRGALGGIHVFGPLEIGSTKDVMSVYCLFAVLRELCKWVEGPFRDWMMAMLALPAVVEETGQAPTGGEHHGCPPNCRPSKPVG